MLFRTSVLHYLQLATTNSTQLGGKERGKPWEKGLKHRAALRPDGAETLRLKRDQPLPLTWDQTPFIGRRTQN